MSGIDPGLADLVTQAPEGASSSYAPPALTCATEVPPNLHAKSPLCRCLFRPRSESAGKPLPKLASIVPAPQEVQLHPPQDVKVAVVPAQVSENRKGPTDAKGADPPSLPKPSRPVEAGGQRLQPEDEVERQLGPQVGKNVGRKTLVLDLDETLVHSSFRFVPDADILVTVEIEGEHHRVYVRKRPAVDEFMVRVAEMYEVVVYTASMAKYANPLLDQLDKQRVIAFRLFREACTRQASGYVKDLSRLGRNLKDLIIIDNSPTCYALQPDNAIPIKTWRDDVSDRELVDLIPILQSLAKVDNIPLVLKQSIWSNEDDVEDHYVRNGA
mmetsp:Transcript_36448/g.100388  ORF Transcript_36448/g.100388 Transcript_36448/m.100388 type:complete len:327 (+) Transcript_36448:136-1116(+)|eukprot:CAMPEP_0117458988 /NCGR_PEP_ID=MMETSP0784-20121206/1228_1 /TAXON_ID=39447 /ORGANISM="" /LENGTH=326 /DNA_ID=CAMNT_0005252551 /DNA_START=116 /DNA_END=1096 /DNA_ORIENTATION=+